MRRRHGSHVTLTLVRELRETLRDRRTLVVMILFPLVVYPLLWLLLAQVASAKGKQQEERRSRVTVGGTGAAAQDLRERIRAKPERLTLVDATADAVQDGAIDAFVNVSAPSTPGPVAVEIVYDSTRTESREARERLDELIGRALPPTCTFSFDATPRDLADVGKGSARKESYLLAKALPLALVLMMTLGALYPAVDVTAGERERGTLETLLAAPISRYDLLFGKVLAVTVLAALTGVLNLASVALTALQAVRLIDGGSEFSVPWSHTAAAMVVILPAAFLFASLFVAVASFARGFKDAQNMLMPVYFLMITPAMLGAVGEQSLSGITAVVPTLNVTLLARELLLGKAQLGQAAVVLGSTVLYGCAALAVAARFYASEAFLSPEARKRGAAKDRPPPVDGRPPSPADALMLWGAAFVLLYFLFIPLQRRDLVSGLLLSQWGGLLALVVLWALVTRRRLRDALVFTRPAPLAVLGAVLVGCSAWAAVAVLSQKIAPVPKEVLDQLRRTLLPDDGSRPLWATLLLVALTPAICEEALFRGPLLRGLATKLPPMTAAVVTGVLFGVFHLDVHRLIPTAVLGVLLSYVALESRSIVPAMVAHLCNNAMLLTLATLKLDERLGTLGTAATAALVAGSVLLTMTGVVLIRRGGAKAGM